MWLARLGNVVLAATGVLAGVAFLSVTVLPGILNYRTYTVLSGSMEPAVRTGSIIVAVPVDARALRIGDVITYKSKALQENVTHRVVEIKGDSKHPTFVTKGDANQSPDPWETTYNGPAGKVILSIPLLGYFFHAVGSPQGHVLFLVVPGVALTLMWLWEIWRPQPKTERRDVQLPAGMTPEPTKPQLPTVDGNSELGIPPDAAATLPIRQ